MQIYDKRDDLILRLLTFLTWMGMFLVEHPTYVRCLYIATNSVARVSSHVSDFYTRNKLLTAKLLNQGYRYSYHKLRKAFSKFYRRRFDLVSKFNVGRKSLPQQGLSKPEFYCNLVYKFRKIYACNEFSTQFRKIIFRYKDWVHINVLRQTACMVNFFASLFGCTPAGRASDSMTAVAPAYSRMVPDALVLVGSSGVQLFFFFFFFLLQHFSYFLLSSPHRCFSSVFV